LRWRAGPLVAALRYAPIRRALAIPRNALHTFNDAKEKFSFSAKPLILLGLWQFLI
jgi:hypothetical protein